MKWVLSALFLFGGLLSTSFAGGYHCGLRVTNLTFHSDKAFEVTVKKTDADKAIYGINFRDWEMVSEKVGDQFTISFDLKEMDEKSIDCLNAIVKAYRNEEVLEFGLGDTARKKGKDEKYHSKYLTWFHKTANNRICVHSE